METKSSKKEGIANLVAVLLALLCLVTLGRIVAAKIRGEVFFAFGKYTVSWVLTGSMEDTIPAHSFILVESVTAEEVEEGDVIMFYSEDVSIKGEPNTHRVVKKDDVKREFITRGDNASRNDNDPVPYENVIGRYVCNLAFLTQIADAFTTQLGLFCTLFFTVAGAVLYGLQAYIRIKNEKQ